MGLFLIFGLEEESLQLWVSFFRFHDLGVDFFRLGVWNFILLGWFPQFLKMHVEF